MKQTELNYSVELWNLDRENISILVLGENGATRLMSILRQVYLNTIFGYSDALQAAHDRDLLSLWVR